MILEEFENFVNLPYTEIGFNKTLLIQKLIESDISKNKGNWIRYQLGLFDIINDVLIKHETILSQEEIDNYNSGLELLRKTDFPDIDTIIANKIGDISKRTNIKNNKGEWSYVNKLNTNYSDLAELFSYVIEKMLIGDHLLLKNYGRFIYKLIIENRRDEINGFLSDKKVNLKNMILYYLPNKGEIEDFEMFTNNIRRNTEDGNKAESDVINFLINNGFDIVFQGSNGDYIDMIFGVDIIAYDTNGVYGYKTIQVKKNNFSTSYGIFEQYKNKGVNLGALVSLNNIDIVDLRDNYNHILFGEEKIISENIKEIPNSDLNSTIVNDNISEHLISDEIIKNIDISLDEQDITINNLKYRLKKCIRLDVPKKTPYYYVRKCENFISVLDESIDYICFILIKTNTLFIFKTSDSIKLKNDPFDFNRETYQYGKLLQIPQHLFEDSIKLL